ncbi:MAG: ABC transporter ATP-binding protein [Cyclobacteriaceae bacterium]
MASVSNPILYTKELAIGYENTVICEDINLAFGTNQLVCLLGQNGVGKSTLLRTLSNLQPALNGDVFIGDYNLENWSREELATKLGIVTTEKITNPNMTVAELVSLGRYPYTNWLGQLGSDDQTIVKECISKCKIDYISNKKLGMLSDGQRQKAMIARVLAQNTNIILLDEPTAHLDLVNRAEIMNLLAEIKKDLTIIISTHELALSMRYADQLLLMNFNAPMVCGTPEDLAISGEISKSFHEQGFEIDLNSGNVIFPPGNSKTITIQGSGSAYHWTKHAFERIGYKITNDSSTKITVSIEGASISWKLESPEHNAKGLSIATLIDELKYLTGE